MGHVQAVAQKAHLIAKILPAGEGETLVASAWLHDLGYAPEVVVTGLHALDGGRWLRDHGWPFRIAALVAHHSCALFEAEERGLSAELSMEFEQERSMTADACVRGHDDRAGRPGPRGHGPAARDPPAVRPHRPGDQVLARAEPTLLDAVHRVEGRLAAQPM